MIGEIGQIVLITAFLIACYQGIFAMVGVLASDRAISASVRPAAILQLALTAVAFALLSYAYVTSDFSITNVAENSHSAKPLIYKFTGVWGNHEGSMLLWILILAGFGGVLALRKPVIDQLDQLTLSVQGLIAAAFFAFLIFTSNPFNRNLPAPADGNDLNPLLQDPGLIIHPPFLYLGYVGFSITFAYAVAALIDGKADRDWARRVRPWALSAWVFLTIGIALGSWWAYYELGWGGFWAWDPVENASFMPWLAGTAFLHSVRVVEKRDTMKVWTILLAIMAFSLSLVGTFLVRSGLLTSVHAFAVDPTRGVFILLILSAVIGGSLTLFAWRANSVASTASFAPVSRESAILMNNVLLTTACGTVFIGTFYPLFVDVVSGERLSVGAPYFNAIFAPLMIILMLALAPGALLAWKRDELGKTVKLLMPAGIAFLVALGLAFLLAHPRTIAATLLAGLAAWVAIATLLDLAKRLKIGQRSKNSFGTRLALLPRPYLGMAIAHFALAVLMIGILGAGAWRNETVRLLQVDEAIEIGRYQVTLADVRDVQGPNYISQVAVFDIARGADVKKTIAAERRFYPVRGMQTTEAAIWTQLSGDLYVTLGEPVDGEGWAVRVFFNPFAVFMWIGSGLLALGGLVAATPTKLKQRSPVASAPTMAKGEA